MAKGSLPRRTLLRGIGATLALPVLDAMVPAFSRRALAAVKAPHRFQTFYVPNGMAMEYWTPKGEGSAFELSPILEPLAPYRDQMLILSGIKASWNYIHAGASGSFLTGTPRGGRNEIEIFADVSMDQLLARHRPAAGLVMVELQIFGKERAELLQLAVVVGTEQISVEPLHGRRQFGARHIFRIFRRLDRWYPRFVRVLGTDLSKPHGPHDRQ